MRKVKRLSKARKAAYVLDGGTYCPFCGESERLTADAVTVDDGVALQGIRCGACNREWTDIFRLAGVKETPLVKGTMVAA